METTNLNEQKVLELVKAMNALNDSIDPEYGKIALLMKESEDTSVRYFIQKRAIMSKDGIERWSFVARKEK